MEASDPLSQLDLDHELHRSRSWLMYSNPLLESYYVLFSATHRRAITALAVVFAAGCLVDVVQRAWGFPLSVTIARAVLIALLLLVAVLQYHFGVKPYRPAADAAGFHRMGIQAADILAAARSERAACAVSALMSGLLFTTYLASKQCFEEEVEAHRHPYAASVYCHEFVSSWIVIVQIGTIFILRVRSILGVPLIVLPVLMVYCFRPTAPDDDELHLALKVWNSSIIGIVFAGVSLVLEHGNRKRFEVVARLRQAAVREEVHRVTVARSLVEIIPSIDRLSKNQAVIDINHNCIVSCARIDDFDHWSTNLMPAGLLAIIETLTTQFDHCAQRLGVEKLAASGDMYLASTNLRGRIEGSNPPPIAILDLAQWQLHRAVKVARSHLAHSYPFAMKIAVHCGPCCGAIVGTQSLSYDFYGPAVDTTLDLVRCAPPCRIIVSRVARRVVQQQEARPLDADRSDAYCYEELPVGWSHIDSHLEAIKPKLVTVESGPNMASIAARYQRESNSSDSNGSSRTPQAHESINSYPSPADSNGFTTLQFHNATDEMRYEFLQRKIEKKLEVDAQRKLEAQSLHHRQAPQQRRTSPVPNSLKAPKPAYRGGSQSSSSPSGLFIGTPESSIAGDSIHSYHVPSSNAPSSASHVRPVGEYINESHFAKEKGWMERYSDPAMEDRYHQFLYTQDYDYTKTSCVIMFAIIGATGVTLVVEVQRTMAAALLIIPAGLTAVVRLIANVCGYGHQWKYGGLLTTAVACLFLGGVAAAGHSIVNGLSMYAPYALCSMVFADSMKYPAKVGIVLIMLVNVVGFALVSVGHGFSLLLMLLTIAVVPGFAIAIYVRERQRRSHFEGLLLAEGTRAAARREVMTHHALLEMLIPKALIPAITKKVEGEIEHPQVVQWLGDICVAAFRLDAFRGIEISTPTLTMERIENTFALVDKALHSVGGSLEKIVAIGDSFTVAGPIAPSQQQDLSAAEASQRLATHFLQLETRQDQVLRSAVAMLDLVSNLVHHFGNGVSAALTVDSAFAAVTGAVRPSFDLLGNATRSVRTALQAAPRGYLAMLGPLERLLAAGRIRIPRRPGEVRLGGQDSWALRGAGLVRVRRLLPGHSEPTSPRACSQTHSLFTLELSANPSVGFHSGPPSLKHGSQLLQGHSASSLPGL